MATRDYIQVPVAIAQQIAERCNKDAVVILCYDREHELTHTTTYGVSAFDKENAAAVGEMCTKAIGADLGKRQTFEDFHSDYDPAIYKEAIEFLKTVRGRNGCTEQMVEQAERILKAAGHGVRQG